MVPYLNKVLETIITDTTHIISEKLYVINRINQNSNIYLLKLLYEWLIYVFSVKYFMILFL